VENGVFDGVEHNLDVFCVHCRGEVMEQWTHVVSLCITKQFEQEHLGENYMLVFILDFSWWLLNTHMFGRALLGGKL
jgi:hypothetical protein